MRTVAIFGDSNTAFGNVLNLHYFYDIPSDFTLINCAKGSTNYTYCRDLWLSIPESTQQSVDLVILGSHGNSMIITGNMRDSLITNLAWYQTYVNTIRATLNESAKILACKIQSHYDGAVTLGAWEYVNRFNNLIMGIPDTENSDLGVVEGVDYRDGEAVDKMTDENGDLLGIYGRATPNIHAAFPGQMLTTLRWKKYIDLIPND